MKGLQTGASAAWRRLSVRERLLVGTLAVLAGLAGCIYLVALPGLSAAESARSRLQLAVSDLGEVRSLGASLQAQRSIAQSTSLPAAISIAETLATTTGLTIDAITETGGGIDARLSASSSAQVIAWAEETSTRTAMRLTKLSINPANNGSLVVSARFSRTSE